MAGLRFYSKVAILSICLVGTVWAGDDVEQPMPEVVGPINAEINKLYGTDIQVPANNSSLASPGDPPVNAGHRQPHNACRAALRLDHRKIQGTLMGH